MSPAALLSPPGQALLARLSGADVSGGRALTLASALRADYPPELVAAALTQQALRNAAAAKFSRAAEMLFTREGLEQSSAEQVAAHSAARLSPFAVVADLCCGIGGDLTALARPGAGPAGRRVLAVDRDPASLEFARHNAAVYGGEGRMSAVCADVREVVAGWPEAPSGTARDRAGRDGPGRAGAGRDGTGLDGVGTGRPGAAGIDAVFIDPARRSGGRRLRAGDGEPPLAWCLGLPSRVPAVGIKAAPGLPHELVPPGWETEFVAVGRSLKEALLWSPALATAPRRATVLPGPHILLPERGGAVPDRSPGEYLLDPNPAVTRAGLVEDLARLTGTWKIDPMIAFLAADREVRTPFARTLRVLDSLPWHEKQLARRLRELDIGAADIRRRGLAGDVELIRRRLKLSGSRAAVLVATRHRDRPWALICEPLTGQEAAGG
ncbi:MAG TPA: class I SAM-dependent methyltransferase [Streptosporangiaceae bacterium]|jgi:hypothetical protein